MVSSGMSFEEFCQRELPACYIEMDGELLEYKEASSEITCSFPVKAQYLNPMQTMQGGFIAAAFDNVFGPLSLLAGGKPSATVSMQLTYHRPIKVNERLVINARVIKKGQRTLYMEAEGFNGGGSLIANANSSWMYLV